MKIQEWDNGYFSVMKGTVNLCSRKIDKKKAAIFGNIDGKNKFELVEAVLAYYGNEEFTETTDWIDESEAEDFIASWKKKCHIESDVESIDISKIN